MDLALKTAKNAGKAGEVPIGCVIVRDYKVIATAANRTLTDRDPTAHAEILAIRQAAEAIGTERLVDCDLYVTLEPCTMCAGAISFARLRRLLRRRRSQGRRSRVRGAVLQPAHVPSRAGGLFGGRRERGRDAAAGFFPREAVAHYHRHSGAMRSIEPGISRFRVRAPRAPE
jgi:pyrimidine deaminase RibD-like protein